MTPMMIQVLWACYTVTAGKYLPTFRPGIFLHLQGHAVQERLVSYTAETPGYIQFHRHHEQLIPEQNCGAYNPMYQLVYDQQVMPHPTKPPDVYPHTQAQ
jgi:hypothetical protein